MWRDTCQSFEMPYDLGVIYKFRDITTNQALPLPPGEYLVGREEDCYVQTENTSVSRKHARIVNNEEGVWVEDLGSSNGTGIRGQIIAGPTQLSVGEVVYFGATCYRLDPEIAGDPTPAPTPGLKPAGRQNLMRKTTDKVPLLGSIHFDRPPTHTPTTPPPAAPEPISEAPAKEVAPAPVEKFASYPTISPSTVRERQQRPETSLTSPTPHPAAPSPASHIIAAGHSSLTVWMAFGAGVAVGVLAGLGVAYALMELARTAAH